MRNFCIFLKTNNKAKNRIKCHHEEWNISSSLGFNNGRKATDNGWYYDHYDDDDEQLNDAHRRKCNAVFIIVVVVVVKRIIIACCCIIHLQTVEQYKNYSLPYRRLQ